MCFLKKAFKLTHHPVGITAYKVLRPVGKGQYRSPVIDSGRWTAWKRGVWYKAQMERTVLFLDESLIPRRKPVSKPATIRLSNEPGFYAFKAYKDAANWRFPENGERVYKVKLRGKVAYHDTIGFRAPGDPHTIGFRAEEMKIIGPAKGKKA